MSSLLSMVIFSLSMSISPGPVNFVALTSGLNHGLLKSIKFVAGATIGFVVLLALIGISLGAARQDFPNAFNILKYIGCGYIIFIGYSILNDGGDINTTSSSSSVPSFYQGWLMQWLNPKAWIACLAGCSAFDLYTSEQRLIQFVVIYFLICFLGIACWAILGEKIKRWLSSTKQVRVFNKIMGSILCLLGSALLLN
ncbi:LysE family translocator [Colwelliaceae bacterium MEBiC 14330]